MTELIHLRLETKLRKEIKKIVTSEMFANESEFIRNAIRENIEKYKKIKLLEAFRNTLPEKPTKKISSNIFRDIGLE